MNARSEVETPAVVLRTQAMRESDLVVMVFTAAHGKVPCAARGARKSKRRFAGGLPVGARGEAKLAPGRGSLWNLGGFVPTADHGGLGRDLERFAYAAYLCEITERLSVDLDPDPGIFTGLWGALEDLADSQRDPLTLRAYELLLLRQIGSLPELEVCAVCGGPLDDPDRRGELRFDAARGGALCAAHGQGAVGMRIGAEVVELARGLLDDTGVWPGRAQIGAVAARPELGAARRGLRDVCASLIHAHLSRPLRSTAFFRELARGGALASGSPAAQEAAQEAASEPAQGPSDEDP